MRLELRVRSEVEELHQFFVEWFNGEAPTESLDSYFAPRVSEELFYLTPDAQRFNRASLLAMLRANHGNNPDFNIWVENVEANRTNGDWVLVTYVECQSGAKASASSNRRQTSAILRDTGDGFEWLHIHETWLP